MDMRISGAYSVYEVYRTQRNERPIRKSRAEEKIDTLELSKKAEELILAKNAVMKTPDVREDLVEFYKQKIAKGEYNINSKDIAQKIIDKATIF